MPGMMKPPGGLLQAPPQQQRQPAPGMGSPQGMASMGQPQPDGSEVFVQMAEQLIMTDPALKGDLKAQARSLDMQAKSMMKLMQMAQSMGQDMSPLIPIAEQLKKKRDKVFREMIGKASKG